jgi:hypothetical protein
MRLLDRTEAILEAFFEGAWLKPKAALARLDRRVIREVDRSRLRIGDAVFAGHEVTVRLPASEARLRAVLRAAQEGIAAAVRDHVRERGYHTAGDPAVRIELSDALEPGAVEVEVAYGEGEFDPAARSQSEAACAEAELGETEITVISHPTPVSDPTIGLTLVDASLLESNEAREGDAVVAEIESPCGTRPICENDRLHVGRGSDCALVLNNPRVSLDHAELYVRNGRVRVRDLESTNGTLLSGRRVRDAEVDDCATLRFGGEELRLRYRFAERGRSVHLSSSNLVSQPRSLASRGD